MRHLGLALSLSLVLITVCCFVGDAAGESPPELVLTAIRTPDEVFAEQGFLVEISYRSSLSPDCVERLIKTFDWQFEGTDRKAGSKKKSADESHFTVIEDSIRVRTSIGKPSAATSVKLKIEYGEKEPFKTTNTVSSNPITVSGKPDLSAFLGEWSGVWEWTPDKHGKRSRDAKLKVEADSRKKLLVTFSLGIAYSGSAKALLPREAIPAKMWVKRANLKRKNGIVHIAFRVSHREVELHLDRGELVGGFTTARHDTWCTLKKVK